MPHFSAEHKLIANPDRETNCASRAPDGLGQNPVLDQDRYFLVRGFILFHEMMVLVPSSSRSRLRLRENSESSLELGLRRKIRCVRQLCLVQSKVSKFCPLASECFRCAPCYS